MVSGPDVERSQLGMEILSVLAQRDDFSVTELALRNFVLGFQWLEPKYTDPRRPVREQAGLLYLDLLISHPTVTKEIKENAVAYANKLSQARPHAKEVIDLFIRRLAQ